MRDERKRKKALAVGYCLTFLWRVRVCVCMYVCMKIQRHQHTRAHRPAGRATPEPKLGRVADTTSNQSSAINQNPQRKSHTSTREATSQRNHHVCVRGGCYAAGVRGGYVCIYMYKDSNSVAPAHARICVVTRCQCGMCCNLVGRVPH